MVTPVSMKWLMSLDMHVLVPLDMLWMLWLSVLDMSPDMLWIMWSVLDMCVTCLPLRVVLARRPRRAARPLRQVLALP